MTQAFHVFGLIQLELLSPDREQALHSLKIDTTLRITNGTLRGRAHLLFLLSGRLYALPLHLSILCTNAGIQKVNDLL